MISRGRKIVLAASTSESSEHMHSAWKQMLLATLPSRYASVFNVDWGAAGEVWPDGQAKYVPQGLRVVEALLAKRFPEDDIAVCYADQLDQFLGEDTRGCGYTRSQSAGHYLCHQRVRLFLRGGCRTY